MAEKNSAVSRDTENTIRSDRKIADLKKETSRAAVDTVSLAHSEPEDQQLILEREQSDKAQNLERQKEDSLRKEERLQTRLIAESKLEFEREITDENLLEERTDIDQTTAETSDLLTNEKLSHDLTRTALVTRDQFLAVVSHDLKNPISLISMSANLIRREVAAVDFNSSRVLQFLDIIERSSGNMDRLINDLLDVERMVHGKLQLNLKPGDIGDLLRECQILFSPLIASKLFTMNVEISQKPLVAEFDLDRITQVMSNLIGNALKFCPRGGRISLSAKTHPHGIEVSVADNGPEIPDDKKALIFDRFSQLGDRNREGLGLGLFISKWIVEAHQGQIGVHSEPKKGNTFYFTIPTTAAT